MTTFLLQSIAGDGVATPVCVIDADTLDDALAELGLEHRESAPADGGTLDFIKEGRAVIFLNRFRTHPSYPQIARRTHFALLALPKLYAARRAAPRIDPSDGAGC